MRPGLGQVPDHPEVGPAIPRPLESREARITGTIALGCWIIHTLHASVGYG